MNNFAGYEYSFRGFLDYSRCYGEPNILWVLVGSGILLGTIISIIPQIVSIVRNKSSYGINAFTYMISNLTQFFLVLNYCCLHKADFVGIFQLPLKSTLPRLLSFLNLFTFFIMFFPNVMLYCILFDTNLRLQRGPKTISFERILGFSCFYLIGFSIICLSVVYILFSVTSEDKIIYFGKSLGLISGVCTIIQYMPQFITTCKVKESGSLSIILLAIQAPGGMLNCCFMFFANNDDITTFLSLFLGALQQFILLILCIFYDLRKRRRNKTSTASLRPLLTED